MDKYRKSACLIGICILFIAVIFFKISGGMTKGMDWKKWGGFDNPIDQYYLSDILSVKADEHKIECLEAYKDAWEQELTAYLGQYEARCNHESDKQMVRDYLAAVQGFVEQSENFLNCFDVDEESILWFQIQAYRCAFIEQVRGSYGSKWAGIENNPRNMSANQLYQKFGGFDNPIDRKFLEILDSGGDNEAEFKWAQTNFMHSWGTDAEQLFKILSDSKDYDDTLGYQESMYQWLDALDSRFLFTPEELNAAAPDSNSFQSGTGAGPAIREAKGWIMRLYALQLRSVLKNCPEIEVIEDVDR